MDSPRVVFEDNHILVAVKPVGFLSQGDGTDSPDMLTYLKDYIKVKYNKPGNVYLGLLHRLDRNVSGVMVFAKTSKCASRISEQIRQGKLIKKYHATVKGILKSDSGKLVNYLVKDERANKVKVYDKEVPYSKKCELEYKIIKTVGENSLVDVHLLTGRSHQIRSQFAHIGHPLLGDVKYGGPKSNSGIALESYYLGFNHPITGEFIEFSLDNVN